MSGSSPALVPRDIVREAFAAFPDRTALVTDAGSRTFAALEDRTLRLAAALEARGAGPRRPVGFVPGPRLDHLVEIRLATYECGATLFGIPPASSPEVWGRLLALLRPAVLVHDPAVSPPSLAELVRGTVPDCALVASGGPADDYQGALAAEAPRRSRNAVDPDGIAGLGFTSGTTGVPKGVTATHGAVADSCRRMSRIFDDIVPGREPLGLLTSIPVFAAGSGFILPALARGMTNHIPAEFDAARALGLIARERIAFTFVTPSQLIDLLDDPGIDSLDLSCLRGVVYGTALTPPAKIAEAVRRLGPVLVQGYGMAECLPPVTILGLGDHGTRERPAGRDVLSSAGFPAEGVRVAIEGEGGRRLTPFEIGEIIVSSPTVMPGYFEDADRTERVRWSSPAPADRARFGRDGRLEILRGPAAEEEPSVWWRSGDFGFVDGDGRLYVLDRRLDILRRGGRTLYPRLIEDACHEHPKVKEACVVQTPGVEAVIAAVSLRARFRAGADASAIAAELAAFLAERLVEAERPDEIRVFPELPRSVQGKVLKREVRAALARAGGL